MLPNIQEYSYFTEVPTPLCTTIFGGPNIVYFAWIFPLILGFIPPTFFGIPPTYEFIPPIRTRIPPTWVVIPPNPFFYTTSWSFSGDSGIYSANFCLDSAKFRIYFVNSNQDSAKLNDHSAKPLLSKIIVSPFQRIPHLDWFLRLVLKLILQQKQK